MMGTQSSARQTALFSYRLDLEQRVAADHLLRQLSALLDLSFVIPTVRHCYGRSGHVSLDPRLIVKMLLLLFLYDVPSERELMEQIRVRLDFLWFLGWDLESDIPDHSVLSKARARWGSQVFERLFVQTVQQCVQAGLVQGRLLHLDSTMVKANASKDAVVASGPELVGALRQAYQEQAAKLQVLPPEPPPSGPPLTPGSVPAALNPSAGPEAVQDDPAPPIPVTSPAPTPELRRRPRPALKPAVAPGPKAPAGQPPRAKLPVNRTHVSTTDPEAELARSKNGVTELNYKDHRMVDDAHGVITAVAATTSNVADGTQLPFLYEQHLRTSGLKQAHVALAGDRHYGTAPNYLFCAQAGLRAHLGEASAHLQERGHLPLSQFVYEPAQDRLRCPQGHYLVCHQHRPQAQGKVYLIEDASQCLKCALRPQCTQSKRGRSIQRHVQAEVVEAARAEAHSPAGRYSRRRRQHVMEGSFADAHNNHGAKRARWRGLWRQKIQSWLIAAVQNLRVLLRHQVSGPVRVAAGALVGNPGGGGSLERVGWILRWWGGWAENDSAVAVPKVTTALQFVISPRAALATHQLAWVKKRPLGQHALTSAATS
jgi:transposase